MRYDASSRAWSCPRSERIAVIRRGVIGIMAACVSMLSGCAIYHARPLPAGPDLHRAPSLTVPAGILNVPGLRPARIDPAAGLTEINVMTLAVVDNPQLKAMRKQAGVAHAQLLEAGLLPDPQLSGGLSKSTFLTGYSVALAEDVQALVTRSAAEDAARAHLRQVNLSILWQEWQVAERARELYIQSRAFARLRQVLHQRRTLLATLYARDEAALRQHFVTAGAVAADFIAWDSAVRAWRAFELQENTARHALDELLGLGPDVPLRLRGSPGRQILTPAEYHSARAALARRRPDLLALRAGYHSEEERLREAILAQFPLISAGVEKNRDPQDGIQAVGFNVTLTLPLFNRNRGPIAVGRATRAYLYQAYQARLDQTTSQADQVWKSVTIMQRQLRELDQRLAGLTRSVAVAGRSLRLGNSTYADYARLESNALTLRGEQIELRASLEGAQAALATLLALPL